VNERERKAQARQDALDTSSTMSTYQAFNRGWEAAKADSAYRQDRPNHFFHDSLGDPDACTEDHNHPTREMS
jgi:hypothetical protein